jgi:hypothetical protein
VKHWQISLAILATLSASLALAQNFTTINGKQYKNATVMRVEPDGIVIKFSGGIVKIYCTELPPAIQKQYGCDPAKAAAAHAAEVSAVQQTNQQVEESNKQRKEDEQQKALENQLSQLQQQEENLRAQIGGAAPGTVTDAHERSKLGLGQIAAGGGVHATDAQLAQTYEQWANERALAGNLAEAERYNAMADQVKERIPELRSSEKPLHAESTQNASDSLEALRGQLSDVHKEKQRVTQELEQKKEQHQP